MAALATQMMAKLAQEIGGVANMIVTASDEEKRVNRAFLK